MRVSILSQRAAKSDQQVRLGGRIRPGIKVLKKAANDNPKAKELYAQGVAKRLKFSEIEKLIKDATGLENPMYPLNTPFFNVAASDFGMPEIASMIVDQFGEIREGDSQKRLYRFPVVFHSDNLNDFYPNEFRRYGGKPNYESHVGDDGEQYCRYLPEVTQEMLAEQKIQRIKRPPRREKVIRGKCDPNVCPEYLQGQCKFRGRLLFYIPGIPTTGLLGMETTSEYAAEAIWGTLSDIRRDIGHIPRCNPNKPGSHIFFISKILAPRTYYNEAGQKKSGLQWVPVIQADIDMGTLLANGMTPQVEHYTAPVAWIAPPKGMPNAQCLPAPVAEQQPQPQQQHPQKENATEQQTGATTESAVSPLDSLLALMDEMQISEELAAPYFDLKLGSGWEDNDQQIKAGITQLESLKRVGGVCAQKLMFISLKTHDMGIEPRDFQSYTLTKYGRGYTGNEAILESILVELNQLAGSGNEVAQSYIKAQIANQLQTA